MKVYCMSDLHVDFEENREALFDLRQHDYGQDAMIVAGDISDDLELVRLTLSTLKSIFREIFYVPGNHELWLTDKDKQIFGLHNSVEKFQYICNLCDELGIQTKPMLLASAEVWVAPLFSWYSVDFDETFDHEADLRYQKLFDCQCKWPFQIKFDSSSDSHSVSLSSYFAEINASRGHLRRLELFPIISFSHFVPRKDLLPKRESLRFKHLYRYAGNPLIEQQLRHLGSSTHIFGHTHIPCDKVISGVRYFSLPFAYPEERHRMQRLGVYSSSGSASIQGLGYKYVNPDNPDDSHEDSSHFNGGTHYPPILPKLIWEPPQAEEDRWDEEDIELAYSMGSASGRSFWG